jgi:hypothetical protein
VKQALTIKLAAALALASPLMASAESQLITGATGSATARLDFRVIIPRVLFLGVGTGAAALANNSTIDLVTFDYTTNPAALGSGAAAGVITGNVVPVRVLGNNGQITLTASTVNAMSNGVPLETISWADITAVSSVAGLPSPVIPASGTGAAVNVTLTSGTKITDRTANWTFSYANTATPAPGTYGATVANNSRVTYTAAMP